jgi:hypothetical protein
MRKIVSYNEVNWTIHQIQLKGPNEEGEMLDLPHIWDGLIAYTIYLWGDWQR